MAGLAECVPIQETELTQLADFARSNNIGLTVVGPEEPLTKGIADIFRARGLKVFGPSKEAAMLEGSKVFSKEIMAKAGIPTAAYRLFDNPIKAILYARKKKKCVIKADGLAAGKGVFVCQSSGEAVAAIKRIMVEKAFGSAGDRVIIEELLEGEEASILAFSDGKTVRLMVSSQDHKRAYDNDEGPNTGGMGAYSPAPVATKAIEKKAMAEVMLPAVKEMRRRGTQYSGVLYAGLMVRKGKISVLEFNVRFGDPEAQVVLPRLKTDIVKVMVACADGTLGSQSLRWTKKAATCVVMASGGYPGKYVKGEEITGLDDAAKIKDTMVFHAGTRLFHGRVLTNGGRVLGVTALADTLRGSIRKAYKAVSMIKFRKMHYRKDIGMKALRRPE
jgi:phosphoribosylamine--glycine ligase